MRSIGVTALSPSWRLAVIMMCMLALPSLAAEIHVAPGGDDANVGTVDNPLATLRAALGKAGPGDVVRLAEGTYREGGLVIERGGEPGRPLVIEGQPDARVVVAGSRLVGDWQPHGAAGVWKVDNWPVNSQQLFAGGQPLQQIGVHNTWQKVQDIGGYTQVAVLKPIGTGVDDLVPGSFFYDAQERTLYCILPDQSDPNGRTMEASVEDFVLIGGEQASHVTLRNITFRHSNMTARNSRNGGVVTVGPSHWTIEDCRFLYGDFGGLGLRGEHHTVRRSHISHNGAVGINLNGSDAEHNWRWRPDRPNQHILLEDLVVTGNNYRRFYDQWHAGGMKIIPSARGITIRRCTVTDNHGAGIWFDAPLGDNRIEDNFVANNRTGIFYEISHLADSDDFGAIIRNNRVINHVNQGIYVSASSHVTVEQNTIYNARWGVVLHGMPRREFGGRTLMHNRVTNNIIHGSALDLVLFTGKDSGENTIDGNFYVQPVTIGVTPSGRSYDEQVWRDLSELAAATGLEPHGAAGDPQWSDPRGGDVRTPEDSPAAGKGWQAP